LVTLSLGSGVLPGERSGEKSPLAGMWGGCVWTWESGLI